MLTAACRPQATWVESYEEVGVSLLDFVSRSGAAAAKGSLARGLPGVLHTRVMRRTLLPSEFPRDQAGSDPLEGLACFLGNVICYLRGKGDCVHPGKGTSMS